VWKSKRLGIPVLTEKVDIAHARLEFAESRGQYHRQPVSTERVRKMRFSSSTNTFH